METKLYQDDNRPRRGTIAYAIQYRPGPTQPPKLSQEAYYTLTEAQRFVEGRSGNPTKCSDYQYKTPTGEKYCICPITMRGENQDA